MDEKELKALVSLLDDEDAEIFSQVQQKILSMGEEIIPYLENAWENTFNSTIQRRLEDLIHSLQFENLQQNLTRWKQEGGKDILEGMWLVSTYQYPDLEFETIKKEFEQIFYEIWIAFKPDAHHLDQIKIINSVLFSKLKFSPNTKNFHSPANSMINMVLQTRKGNPISLCVVYMMVAQKLNLPVYGVNLPNLFILTYKDDQTQFYINAFNRGLIFSRADIDNYISNLRLAPNHIFYQPCDNVEVVKRVLRNLNISFEKLGDHYRADEIRVLLKSISEPGEDLG